MENDRRLVNICRIAFIAGFVVLLVNVFFLGFDRAILRIALLLIVPPAMIFGIVILGLILRGLSEGYIQFTDWWTANPLTTRKFGYVLYAIISLTLVILFFIR